MSPFCHNEKIGVSWTSLYIACEQVSMFLLYNGDKGYFNGVQFFQSHFQKEALQAVNGGYTPFNISEVVYA